MRTKQQSIEELDVMLSRKFGWDDDEALPMNKLTYQRVKNWINNNISSDIISPRVSLCPDGSVDLDWYKDDYSLLLNIENKKSLEIHYYGCKWLERGTAKNTEKVESILLDKETDEKLINFLKKNFKL